MFRLVVTDGEKGEWVGRWVEGEGIRSLGKFERVKVGGVSVIKVGDWYFLGRRKGLE